MSLFQFQFVMNEQKLTTSEPTTRFIFRVPVLFLYFRHQCFIDKLGSFISQIDKIALSNELIFIRVFVSICICATGCLYLLLALLFVNGTDYSNFWYFSFMSPPWCDRKCNRWFYGKKFFCNEWQLNLSGTVWIILFVAKDCEFLSGNIGCFFVVKFLSEIIARCIKLICMISASIFCLHMGHLD